MAIETKQTKKNVRFLSFIEKLKTVYSALIYLLQIKDITSPNHRLGKRKRKSATRAMIIIFLNKRKV